VLLYSHLLQEERRRDKTPARNVQSLTASVGE